MCDNPLAHPELTGGPMARRGLTEGATLCGQHNAEFPTLEDVLEGMGLAGPVAIPATRVCTACTHIQMRLN